MSLNDDLERILADKQKAAPGSTPAVAHCDESPPHASRSYP
jgi:hypothetical protein